MTLASAIGGVYALKSCPTAAAVLAFAVAALSAIFTFLNPKDRAMSHLAAGNAYKALNNDVRIFHRIDCASGLGADKLRGLLAELNARRNDLNSKSHQIPRPAFEKARKGIEAGEARYAVDDPPAPAK